MRTSVPQKRRGHDRTGVQYPCAPSWFRADVTGIATFERTRTLPKLFATFLVTLAAMALAVSPAAAHGGPHGKDRHAKTPDDYAYVATIDCGRGPVTVYSGEDLYAPLVDLDRHRFYAPIAWDVEVNGETVLQDKKPGVPGRLKHMARDCSYTDGVAEGTVTVLGPFFGTPS
jgi:hypothetical protein